MKKSNASLNKFSSLKDILNGLNPITVVCLMVFAIFMVIGTFEPTITPEHQLESNLSHQLLANSISSASYEFLFACNETDVFPFVIPFIIALSQFSYLHRKDCCYTLLSFGIKRNKLYTNRVALPLVAMVLITLIVKGITLGINIYYKTFDTNLLKAWLIHVAIYLQIILVIYAVTVLCCHFCGRTIEAAAASLSFLLLPFALTFLSQEIFSFSLYGYDSYSETFFSKALEFVNPICLEDYGASTSGLPYYLKGRVIATSIWLVISIAMLIATEKYFEKSFKPEISGFKGAKKGIVYIISLSAPILFAFFGFELIRSYYHPLKNTKITIIAILTTILLGFVGALLCNFVVHFTFKRFKIALVAGCSIALIIGAINLLGLSGIFGTFNKLPSPAEIESVRISQPFSNFISITDYSSFLDNYYPSYGPYIEADSEEDIQLVLDIHENILEDRNTESVSRLDFVYHLKNGDTLHREYIYLSESTVEKALKIRESDAARSIIGGYLLPEDNHIKSDENKDSNEPVTVSMEHSKIEFTSKHNVKTDVAPTLTYEQSYELRKAVLSDLLEFSAEEWYRPTEKSLGEIAFTTHLNEHVNIKGDVDNTTNEFFFTTPIYESMKNTIAVLQKYDLLNTLTEKAVVRRLYVADYKELAEWGNKTFNTANAVDLMNPFFDMNFYLLMHIEPYKDAPIRQITDRKEIEKYIENGYTQYLVGNDDATYVMVEFEGSTPDIYKGNIFMIPKQ